jgi:hypothetical protein
MASVKAPWAAPPPIESVAVCAAPWGSAVVAGSTLLE